jgi:cytoskeletal protein CcmA (bactofilin family)
MFRRNNKENSSTSFSGKKVSSPTVIASDMNILGNLLTDGTADIDGRVEGNIKGDQIIIRGNGKIKGDITADSVHVYGEVKGLIKAKMVHLYATCRVEGIIMHESLSIEDGAFVDGKFKRTDKIFSQDEGIEESIVETSLGNVKVLENLRLIGSNNN